MSRGQGRFSVDLYCSSSTIAEVSHCGAETAQGRPWRALGWQAVRSAGSLCIRFLLRKSEDDTGIKLEVILHVGGSVRKLCAQPVGLEQPHGEVA